jgi:hypothetical protein
MRRRGSYRVAWTCADSTQLWAPSSPITHVLWAQATGRCAVLSGPHGPTHGIRFARYMDIVIDEQWGNAKDAKAREYWLSAANAGYIAGFLAGPPCETWSVARGRKLDVKEGAQRRAPRILRTAEHLWGLPSLALKELEQILTGNFLLTFSLLMACTMVRTGGMGVLEHPAGRQSGSCPLYKRFFKHLEFGGIGFRRGSTAHHPQNQRTCWSLTCRTFPWLSESGSSEPTCPRVPPLDSRLTDFGRQG